MNVSADDSVLAEDGKPDISKIGAISYDSVHQTYLLVDKTVGKAFSDGKKLIKE